MDKNLAVFYNELVNSVSPKNGSIVIYPSWKNPPAYISESLAQMFGYTAEEMASVLKDSYVSCIHPDDYEIADRCINDRIEKNRKSAEIFLRGRKKDGSYLWLMAIGSLCLDHNGEDVYAVCITDITEQKDTEEKLRLWGEEYRLAAINNGSTSVRYDIRKREVSSLCHEKLPFSEDAVMDNMPDRAIEEGLISEESADDYRAFFDKIHAGQPSGTATFRYGRSNSLVYCKALYTTIFDTKNKPAYAIISFENVTSLRKIELAYERWRQSISAMPKSSYLLAEQNITNGAYENIEGDLLERFIDNGALPVQDCIRYIAQRSLSESAGALCWKLRRDYLLEAFNRGEREFDTEFQMLDKEGRPVWLSLNVQTVGYADSDEVKGFFLCKNIDSEKERELFLRTKAERDELTGVYNRHTFISKVENIIAESKDEKHAIIIMDLDRFKSVNDTYGHVAGDRVLNEASELLRSFLRGTDILGRIGGDEFMVCMRNVTDEYLLGERAKIMCRMFEKQWTESYKITVSAGIAMFPADGDNFEDLYKHADIALYMAKERGRNQFAFYNGTLLSDGLCPNSKGAITHPCIFAKPEFGKVSNILKVNDMLIKQQEAYERYKMAFEYSGTVMFEWNLLNSSFFAPHQMKQYVLGVSDMALMLSGDAPSDAVHRSDCDSVTRFILQKLSGADEHGEITLRLRKIDGSYEWCRFGVIVVKDKESSPVKIMGLITPLRIAGGAAAIQLSAFLDNLSSGIMLVEMKEDPVPFYVSEKFYESEAESIDMCRSGKVRMIDLICQDDREEVLKKMWHSARTGEPVEYTMRHFRNGKTAWKHVDAVRIQCSDKEAPVLMLELHDITKQKEAELDNLKLAKQLSMALEMTGVTTYEVDFKRMVLSFAKAAAQRYSLTEEISGVPESLFKEGRVHPSSAETMRRFCADMLSGVEHGVCIVRCKGAESSVYVKIRASYRLIYDESGKPSKAVGILEDLGT